MLTDVAEARNMALKAEMMMQEKKGDWSKKNRFSSAPTTVDQDAPTYNSQKQAEKFANDRAVGKRPVNGAHKQTHVNPYGRPTEKCYGCHQIGHNTSDCPQRKGINIVESGEHIEDGEKGNELIYGLDGDSDGEDFDERQIYVVRKMMLVPKKEEMTQLHLLFRIETL